MCLVLRTLRIFHKTELHVLVNMVSQGSEIILGRYSYLYRENTSSSDGLYILLDGSVSLSTHDGSASRELSMRAGAPAPSPDGTNRRMHGKALGTEVVTAQWYADRPIHFALKCLGCTLCYLSSHANLMLRSSTPPASPVGGVHVCGWLSASRKETVKALTPCRLLHLAVNGLSKAAMELEYAQGTLPLVPLFQGVDEHVMQGLQSLASFQDFERVGDVIFHDGELQDTFYILTAGQVEIEKDGNRLASLTAIAANPHDCYPYFGEIGLLYNMPCMVRKPLESLAPSLMPCVPSRSSSARHRADHSTRRSPAIDLHL